MITIESANPPLEFAYVAAKLFSYEDAQVRSLRHIASLYAKSDTPDDLEKGLAVTQEALQMLHDLNRIHMCDFVREYPSFAIDYASVGRQDLAHDVIVDSIRIAEDLSPTERLEMRIATAVACRTIGEHTRCTEILDSIAPYVQRRKRFRKFGDSNIGELVTLYLTLGLEPEAVSVAEKMTGSRKPYVVANLAFIGLPSGHCREKHLDFALQIATREEDDYLLGYIAELMGKSGMFSRAQDLIARIGERFIWFESMLTMATLMIESGLSADAMAVIDELGKCTDTHYCDNMMHLGRLISLLHVHHTDVVRLLINRTLAEINSVSNEPDRLRLLQPFAELVASVSTAEADVLVDEVLNLDLSVLDAETDPPNYDNSPYILYDLLICTVKKHLRWDGARIQSFREHLTRYNAHGFQ